MPRVYMAGPILRPGTMPEETRSKLSFLYQRATTWSEIRAHHRIYIPHDASPWIEGPFSVGVRKLIQDSTHVVVCALLESIAVGIEAEYAHQLGKPIGVWYPDFNIRSKMLSAISTVERSQGESVDSMLNRLTSNY